MKLSYSAIDNVVLTTGADICIYVYICSQQVSGLLSGAQRLDCDKDGKQTVGVLPRSNSPLGVSLGYSAALPILFQLAQHELMLCRHLLTDAYSYLHLLCQR